MDDWHVCEVGSFVRPGIVCTPPSSSLEGHSTTFGSVGFGFVHGWAGPGLLSCSVSRIPAAHNATCAHGQDGGAEASEVDDKKA